MENKRLYLTKENSKDSWYYITDPLNPTSVQETGVVTVDREEIRVDQFGAYVTRFYPPNQPKE